MILIGILLVSIQILTFVLIASSFGLIKDLRKKIIFDKSLFFSLESF